VRRGRLVRRDGRKLSNAKVVAGKVRSHLQLWQAERDLAVSFMTCDWWYDLRQCHFQQEEENFEDYLQVEGESFDSHEHGVLSCWPLVEPSTSAINPSAIRAGESLTSCATSSRRTAGKTWLSS